MKDKTREAIKAEVIGIINRNPADSFDMDGCVNRLTSLITAQADGVTDEEIEAEADKLYPTRPDQTDSYNLAVATAFGGFIDGAKWLRSKLAAPKQDAPQ